ncbi:unnamed protein product, partial [Mesorhabditis belari]|uniref:glutathione transferase n=1 Tax=Mesorhabditis belari TaxID=2138241 RepID=A0AAF3ERJ0_9BILA
MPHYKLIYFAVRGKGEFIRQLFTLAGVEFEDFRQPLGSDEWPAMKKETPYGYLPVLEVDGKQLGQANAIAKFIANEHGLNGSNAWEAALIDSVGIHYDSLFEACRPFYKSWLKISDQPMEEAFKLSVEPGRDEFFPAICKFLRGNESGYIIGEKPSWIDLLVADHCTTFLRYNPNYLDKYPEAKAHMERIHSIPAIKKWIEAQPQTEI